MADIIRFDKKPARATKAKNKTLCAHGFHKWTIFKEKQFDVRQGKLVTIYRCERCSAQKVKAL
jgi:hypothetical protein